jgi:hypothetical protein
MKSLIRGRIPIATGVVAVLAWVGLDLYGPRSHDLRDFQPGEVGRLEAAMWQAYYEKANLRLFGQLATLLRQQYDLPVLRSHLVAFHAARAAALFQRGHTRSEYETALPDLQIFYSAIAVVAVQRFDAQRAARLELEWWIVHRERASHAAGDLTRSLAELQAELYHASPTSFLEHASERAAAMLLRDTKAEHGNVTMDDWRQIEEKLQNSWKLLWRNVRGTTSLFS